MRDYQFYFDKAKEKQGYLYDNQIDHALGFRGAMTTLLKQGKRHLSEESMISLARLAGIDPALALIDLGYMKTKGEARKTYASILQKIQAVFLICAVLLGLSAAPAHAATTEIVYVMENNINLYSSRSFD